MSCAKRQRKLSKLLKLRAVYFQCKMITSSMSRWVQNGSFSIELEWFFRIQKTIPPGIFCFAKLIPGEVQLVFLAAKRQEKLRFFQLTGKTQFSCLFAPSNTGCLPLQVLVWQVSMGIFYLLQRGCVNSFLFSTLRDLFNISDSIASHVVHMAPIPLIFLAWHITIFNSWTPCYLWKLWHC